MGLATRIIPVLLWNEQGCVKGKQFNPGRCIGSIQDRVQLLERREVDELIILDISATPNNRGPRFDQIKALCENLFMPVTIGGGVKNVSDVRRLLESGADKISIGTAAFISPLLIETASRKFGSQSIVVSIDCKNGEVFGGCGKHPFGRSPIDFAREVETLGAGEIILTSIDRDGTMEGYDLDLIREVSDSVSIPIIAAGGCGTYEHMEQAIKAGAHAVASGAMFQFCEATPKGAARYLTERGIEARL